MSRAELLAWLEANAVRADELGDCAQCGLAVHGGGECSECLEELGHVRHAECCPRLDAPHQAVGGERELVEAILAHAEDQRAANVVRRITARIAELEPLQAFGGSLGAVYAAEAAGLRYALELLEAPAAAD